MAGQYINIDYLPETEEERAVRQLRLLDPRLVPDERAGIQYESPEVAQRPLEFWEGDLNTPMRVTGTGIRETDYAAGNRDFAIKNALRSLPGVKPEALDNLEALFRSLPEASAAGVPGKEVGIEMLRKAGVLPTEFQTAYAREKGKTMGELAGGGGVGGVGGTGPGLVPDYVTRALGTADFDDAMARAISEGKINKTGTQLALERLHKSKWDKGIPDEKAVTGLGDIDYSLDKLDRLQDAYKKTPAYKTGKVSDALRIALSRSTTFQGFLNNELLPLDKLDKDEIEFAARFNGMLIGMRRLYDDQRMTDQDMERALTALGNPITGRDLFIKQMEVVAEGLHDKRNRILQGQAARGKRTKGLERPTTSSPDKQKEEEKTNKPKIKSLIRVE